MTKEERDRLRALRVRSLMAGMDPRKVDAFIRDYRKDRTSSVHVWTPWEQSVSVASLSDYMDVWSRCLDMRDDPACVRPGDTARRWLGLDP